MTNRVVVDYSGVGSPALKVAPFLPATPQAQSLRMGSQDIIRFAGFAMSHGFKVTGFEIADAHMTPLGAVEQGPISDAMVEILNEYGSNELQASMRDDFAGLYIIAVSLLSLETGFRVHVKRQGFVDASKTREAEQLLESAWRELQLS